MIAVNLVVNESEFQAESSNTKSSIESLASIGQQFIKLLNKLDAMGYNSDAMHEVITEKVVVVSQSLTTLSNVSAPLESTVSSFVSTIDEIDLF